MLRLLERAIVTFRIVVFEDGEINIAKLIFPFFQLFKDRIRVQKLTE